MRAVPVLLVVAAAGWFFWPASMTERAARRERGSEPAPRERVADGEPPASARAPDLLDRVAEGLASLEESAPPIVHGTVRGPKGEPVVDAQVRAWEQTSAQTDERGRFTLVWPMLSDEVDLLVTAPGYVDDRSMRKRGDALEIELSRGLSVSGSVLFPDGSPVPGCTVEASGPWPDGQREATSGLTDEDGRFKLPGLRAGLTGVSFHARGGRSTTFHQAGATGIRFTMSYSVLRLDLRGWEGGSVRDVSLEVTVDGELAYRKSGLQDFPMNHEIKPGSDVVVLASAPGCRPVRREIRSWSQRPQLHRARIEFERAGDAVALLDVRRADGQHPDTATVRWAGTAREETFVVDGVVPIRLDDLDPGAVVLRIYADRNHDLVREVTVVATEGEPKPTRVDLPAGCSVQVTWPQGNWIRIQRVGELTLTPLASVRGRFRKGQLPAGRYLLLGYVGRREAKRIEVTLVAGETRSLDWSE